MKQTKQTWKDEEIGYSSFWLDRKTFEDASAESLIAMADIQKAIGNFVKILTKKDIPVKYGQRRSYTDGKSVTLASTKDKDFDSTCGLALHEASHIVYTNFDTTNLEHQFCENLHAPSNIHWSVFEHQKNLHGLTNWLEDRRIDYLTKQAAPGYIGYYTAMYNKYFYLPSIGAFIKSKKCRRPSEFKDYDFHIVNFQHPESDLEALPGLRQIYNLMDIKHIGRLKSTEDVFNVTKVVYELILKYISIALTNPKPKPAPKKAPKNSKPTPSKSKAKTKKEKDNDSEGDDSEESGKGKKDSKDDKKESEKKGSGKSEKEDDKETDESSNGSGPSDDKEPEENDDEEGDSEPSDEGKDDEGSETEPSDEDIANEIAKHNEEMKDLEDPPMPKGMEKRLEKDLKDQQKFLEGNVDKSGVSKSTEQTLDLFKIGNAKLIICNAADKDSGITAKYKVLLLEHIPAHMFIKPPKDEEGHEHSAPMFEGSDYKMYQSFADGYPNKDLGKAYTSGVQLGTLLGRKLKIRSDERSLQTNHQKGGKLDKRRITAAGIGEEDVFFTLQTAKYGKTHLHISVDGSGSMGGGYEGCPFWNAMKMAVAVAKAASMTPNISVVVTLRTTVRFAQGNDYPAVVVIYDSRKEKMSKLAAILPHLRAGGPDTPEVLCYEAERTIIPQGRPTFDVHFMTLTDGGPNWSAVQNINGVKTKISLDRSGDRGDCKYLSAKDYCSLDSTDLTRKEIKRFKDKSINLAAYYISNYVTGGYDKVNAALKKYDSNDSTAKLILGNSGLSTFAEMYGKNGNVINTNNIVELSASINKMFLQAANLQSL